MSYFEHFLKLFDIEKSEFAIKKKVACITDLDPVKKEKHKKNAAWVKCSPLFLNAENEKYDYKSSSNTITETRGLNQHKQIKIYTQEQGKSSTFEHDLLLKNMTSVDLLADSVSNQEELKELMRAIKNDKKVEEIASLLKESEYKEQVESFLLTRTMADKKQQIIKSQIIADRYLSSIKKGEVAQELAYSISNPSDLTKRILPPDYIKEAIIWICQKQ